MHTFGVWKEKNTLQSRAELTNVSHTECIWLTSRGMVTELGAEVFK